MTSGCSSDQVRILFALAGLHRIDRGAEVAFISVASELARSGHAVTLIGSGQERPGTPYRFIQAPALQRERFEGWRRLPPLRSETVWEEATFLPSLLASYRPAEYDATVTCAYPFTNWALRRPVLRGKRPVHVFVTQNGDWPAYGNNAEFRLFNCDGLVCTNPHFFDRNHERYRCALIPNGVDLDRFSPGPAERARFGLPPGPIVLMVSALIGNKKVAEGIAAVSRVPDATLVVAGDGPLREEIHKLAGELLPGRFLRLTVPSKDMPDLYRSADAFMHLATDESFGNVFVEAMASGLPIIAYDVPRTRWIIGDGACFPESNDTADLTAAIGRALKHPSAGELHKRAEEFGWPLIAARYEAFFRELLR
jgi:glycosyltransferase involved in cell wall biosynthesis